MLTAMTVADAFNYVRLIHVFDKPPNTHHNMKSNHIVVRSTQNLCRYIYVCLVAGMVVKIAAFRNQIFVQS